MAELNFVMIRLDPKQQAEELAKRLAGPGHDPDFRQYLVDLQFLLDHYKYGDAPLLHWMSFTGSPITYSMTLAPGIALTATSADVEWERHPDLPTLVAALMTAKIATPALLQAAAAVPESSSAWSLYNCIALGCLHTQRMCRALATLPPTRC